MSYVPWFPDPGSYIRYFDQKRREYKYRRLLWRRDPMKYPWRFTAVSAGSRGTAKVFDEINPSLDKRHIYLAYLGVKPGFLFYLWHPYDIKNLKWDEDIEDVDEDLVANITYEESPYEFPTKMLGIEHDRYPSVEPFNVSGATMNPEIIWIASLYMVQEHSELSQDEINRLQSGSLRSHPTDFGGEL